MAKGLPVLPGEDIFDYPDALRDAVGSALGRLYGEGRVVVLSIDVAQNEYSARIDECAMVVGPLRRLLVEDRARA